MVEPEVRKMKTIMKQTMSRMKESRDPYNKVGKWIFVACGKAGMSYKFACVVKIR